MSYIFLSCVQDIDTLTGLPYNILIYIEKTVIALYLGHYSMMYDLGGTIRATTAEQTLTRIEPLLLPKFGITRVADITGLDKINIPTYLAIRPNAKILSTAQGKGFTKPLAKISALMECIEFWHAENVREPDLVGSYNQLKSRYALAALEPVLRGPVKYKNILDRPLPWILTREIFSNQDIFIPYPLVNLDSTNLPLGYESFLPISIGLASGNTFAEAVCHGLYEVIERDCVYRYAKIGKNESEKRQVVLESIDCPHNQALIHHIQQANLKLYIWDVSSAIGLPTFFVALDDPDDAEPVGVFLGYGAHLSRTIALSRAITEAVQSRLTLISGSRDDMLPILYKNKIKHHTAYGTPKLDFNQCPNLPIPTTFDECIEVTKNLLQKQGINQVFLFDHTRPDIGIAVVHTFIPALNFKSKHSRDY
jgi:ribosomal protein S12 methylthiotransferase accessory factor